MARFPFIHSDFIDKSFFFSNIQQFLGIHIAYFLIGFNFVRNSVAKDFNFQIFIPKFYWGSFQVFNSVLPFLILFVLTICQLPLLVIPLHHCYHNHSLLLTTFVISIVTWFCPWVFNSFTWRIRTSLNTDKLLCWIVTPAVKVFSEVLKLVKISFLFPSFAIPTYLYSFLSFVG